ncbi:cell division protein FtsW [Babesia caballi]|uniref:Cell division protein FtsW n=1 Tax=Babesia caballi TaxID=5871 RepID=A0AAV4LVX7_BABCB|nr:cell division protein FtsW [Babesia caballi]
MQHPTSFSSAICPSSRRHHSVPQDTHGIAPPHQPATLRPFVHDQTSPHGSRQSRMNPPREGKEPAASKTRTPRPCTAAENECDPSSDGQPARQRCSSETARE